MKSSNWILLLREVVSLIYFSAGGIIAIFYFLPVP